MRLQISVIIQKLEDVEEDLDDVEVEGDGGEDVRVLIKLRPLLITAHNHLRIPNQIRRKQHDTANCLEK